MSSGAKTAGGMTMAAKLKLAGAAVAAVLFLLFVFFNWQQTEVWLLGMKLSMPLAMLIFLVGGLGFVCGWTVRALRARKQAKQAEQPKPA